MNDRHKTFSGKAKSWAVKNNLHGREAFPKFVMLAFVERLNRRSNEFVFKGGNLLWLYIKTPRGTVDLDFVTRSVNDHNEIRKLLDMACESTVGSVNFEIDEFKEIETKDGRGAAVRVKFSTDEGQSNKFELDIVYAIKTMTVRVPSPVHTEDPKIEEIEVASMENIIADKISAAFTFGSGNTRMKDFDDLWRISQYEPNLVNWDALQKILAERSLQPRLDLDWLAGTIPREWERHCKRYPDLPRDIGSLFQTVNKWLETKS